MELSEIFQIIRDAPLAWNPLQTPEWHLHIWRQMLIDAITEARNREETAKA